LFIWICDDWTFSPGHSGFSRRPLDGYTLKGLFAVVSSNAVSSPGEIETACNPAAHMIIIIIFFLLCITQTYLRVMLKVFTCKQSVVSSSSDAAQLNYFE